MLKKKILLPLMVVFALALTGCTTDGDVDPEVETPPVENEVGDDTGNNDVDVDAPDVDVPEVNVGDEIEDITVEPVEAFEKFMEKYPNAMVTKFELEENLGKYEYEIEGFETDKEYEVKIDATNGEFTKDDIQTEIIDEEEKNEVITKENVEKAESLLDKALMEAGEGAKIDKWNIEFDDNMVMLEVKTKKDALDSVELTYNLETGELVEKDD